MTETKYGHLVRPLTFRKGLGGANAKQMVYLSGEELAGFNLNIIVGVYDETGDWAPGRGAHAHSFDEFLVFFGHDTDDLGYLGSDMEIALGKELEKHTFSIPSIVVVPGGIPHCPLITMKVYKPFGHFHLALNPKYTAVPVKPGGKTDGKKYRHLVKKLLVKEGPGGANAKQIVTMSGKELGGINLNLSMGLYQGIGQWYPDKGALLHPYDEVLVFFGHNVNDLSYLGAELTIELGREHERHTINTSTAVAIPKGLPHLPVVCNRLDQPYSVIQVGLGPQYESSWDVP